ncbi:MAG TPA: hypothetical protein VES60_00675, partial [Nakamurella sp.]|nr:hypothetical protein [Nakamurella sp.]
TNEVADRLAATGTVPAPLIDQLRQAANDSFMPALHTAAFVSAGLLVIAIAVVLVWLPARAEAVAWAGSHPGEDSPDDDGAAEGRVHFVDEEGNDLEHVGDIPLEYVPTGRHHAREDGGHLARHGAPVGVADAPAHQALPTNSAEADLVSDGDVYVTAANAASDGRAMENGATANGGPANGGAANGARADRTWLGTTTGGAAANGAFVGRHATPEELVAGGADQANRR